MYSNSMHNNMMRRNNNTVKTVGIVVVAGLFLYGLYAYHDLHTRHTRSEEKADRLRQQHDSLSAQLQVVYEQKSRLDKLLQQEKADHKQSKDDLNSEKRRIEQKYLAEKQELLNRIKSISAEHKMLQNQHEDLENTFTKLQQQLLQLDDDCKKASEQHQQEYNQMKQEKENELAQVRDDLANMQRHNVELQRQLQAAIQQNQISQHQVDAEQQNIEKLREQLAQLQDVVPLNLVGNADRHAVFSDDAYVLKQAPKNRHMFRPQQHGLLYKLYNNNLQGNLVANLAQEQKVQTFNQQQQSQGGVVDSAAQQKAQQQLIAQQGAVQDAYKIKQQGLEGQREEQAQLKDMGQNADLQDTQQHEGLFEDRQAAIQHKEQQQAIDQQQPDQQQQQQAPVMQLAQPDEQRKSYFDPKEAKPDHEVIIHDVKEQNEEDNNAGAVHHQVLAPDIIQLGVDVQKDYMDKKNEILKNAAYQRLKEDQEDQGNWRNMREPDEESDKEDDKVEDKHYEQDRFNHINQIDHGGAPILGPNVEQGDEPIRGPIPNMDAIAHEDHKMDSEHRPGQIVGPDVKDNHVGRIEAPVGQGQDMVQGQLHIEVGAKNEQNVRDEEQLQLPGGHIPLRNDMYQDGQGAAAAAADHKNDEDNDDQDDEEDDQLDNYPK